VKKIPKTMREAAAAGVEIYFTGRPCKRGHVAMRTTINGACIECNRQRSREYQQRRRAAIRAKLAEKA
jgi:hypothetical protein